MCSKDLRLPLAARERARARSSPAPRMVPAPRVSPAPRAPARRRHLVLVKPNILQLGIFAQKKLCLIKFRQ